MLRLNSHYKINIVALISFILFFFNFLNVYICFDSRRYPMHPNNMNRWPVADRDPEMTKHWRGTASFVNNIVPLQRPVPSRSQSATVSRHKSVQPKTWIHHYLSYKPAAFSITIFFLNFAIYRNLYEETPIKQSRFGDRKLGNNNVCVYISVTSGLSD